MAPLAALRDALMLFLIEIGVCLMVILQKTPINTISLICFHLNHRENGKYNSSAEDHHKSSKTRRWSYLELELIILSRDPVPLIYCKYIGTIMYIEIQSGDGLASLA
jgi:hypothetical protein